ncbi:MAG: AAA family ATPase [Defluviitaleaceae bacterium]|nr:AAA family ATPase [Defluviitaleaceae bacterium]
MKLVVLIGAGAVGKMTVGQELAKITDLRLYHGHMDIELDIAVFGKRTRVSHHIREVVFEEFAKSELYGMIFTFMWAFDQQSNWDYIDRLVDIFRRECADIYYIELVAPQEVRLARNITENRLQNKATKRNIEWSNTNVKSEDENYRLVSNDGELAFENYIKIDNSDLSPDVVANMIKITFNL